MSLQAKQQYLRTSIVEQGLDAQQFYQFWQTYNLDLATAQMEQVQAIVHDFVNRNTKQINEEDQDDEFGEYVQAQAHEPNVNGHLMSQDINWDFLAEIKTEKNTKIYKSNELKQQQLIEISDLNETRNQKESQQKIQNKKVQNNKQNSTKKQQSKHRKGTQIAELSYNQQQMSNKKQNNLLSMDIDLNETNVNNITFKQVLTNSQQMVRKCLKLSPNILQHHSNIQISITSQKQVTQQSTNLINKLWKGSYVLFTIKTVGRNKQKAIGISWEVLRQHSDFQWLRSMLIKMYPGVVVPPLPLQVSVQKSLSQFNGYKRKLQAFLVDCYNCPELRNSKYYQAFLSYLNAKDFQNFKKGCENTSRPKNLTHILNMNGQLKLMYSQKMDQYAEGLQNFLTKTSQHLKNVKSITSQIDELYSSVSSKYKQLSSIFVTMSEESCSFSEEQCYPRLTETYKQISQLVAQHSYFCQLEKQFLETFMVAHFAYERDRVDNMQNLITKRKLFSTQFSKPKHQTASTQKPKQQKASVFGKITNLFGESKSQSLQIPSSDTFTLKQQVGYYNSQLMKESIRCVDGMITSHINHFSMYGHSRIDNVELMQKVWSKILVELSRLSLATK